MSDDKRPPREWWITTQKNGWAFLGADSGRGEVTLAIEKSAYQELVDANQILVSEKQAALDELAYYKDLHDRGAVIVDITAQEVFRKERDQAIDEIKSLEFNLEQKSREIGRAEHRGNTVDYIYDKCETYKRQLGEAIQRAEKAENAEDARLSKIMSLGVELTAERSRADKAETELLKLKPLFLKLEAEVVSHKRAKFELQERSAKLVEALERIDKFGNIEGAAKLSAKALAAHKGEL